MKTKIRVALILCAFILINHPTKAAEDRWSSNGPPGGFAVLFAVDPTTSTTVYAGSNRGGVFKSTDGGTTWTSPSGGGNPFNIRALVIDPVTPANLYAGTLDTGIWKSTNGGASWAAANSGLTELAVQTLVIDPVTPATLYAGTDSGGVFKSIDGAGTWSAANMGLTDTDVQDFLPVQLGGGGEVVGLDDRLEDLTTLDIRQLEVLYALRERGKRHGERSERFLALDHLGKARWLLRL